MARGATPILDETRNHLHTASSGDPIRNRWESMRRNSTSLVVIIAITMALSFARASDVLAQPPAGGAHQDFPPRPGATPIVIGLPNLNPPTATAVPSGGHAQHSLKAPTPPDAVRVALSNAYVKALLRGKAYRIKKVTAWPPGLGKLVVVAFYRPTTVSGVWIRAGKAPYRATYTRVTSLRIYVRPAKKLVVAIAPNVQAK